MYQQAKVHRCLASVSRKECASERLQGGYALWQCAGPDHGGQAMAYSVVLRRVQIRTIRNAHDLRPKDAGFGQGPNGLIAHHPQVPHNPLHNVLGQGIRANRPEGPLALPRGRPRWQIPWRTCCALKPTNGLRASSLNSRLGRALMRSIPNSVFSP
jgi:hypothetical protein